MTLIDSAHRYIAAGCSVVPTNQKKRPTVKSWEQLQNAPMTIDQVETEFRAAAYIAIITGAVSGNLELIDVDSKYDLVGNLWDGYVAAIQHAAPELWAKLTVQKTQNNGYHIIYRCAHIAGNAKLASRDGTPQEVAEKNAEIDAWNTANPDKTPKRHIERVIKTLIETRGEGGYALVYPSAGYELLQGSLLDVQEITPAEREILFSLATIYNTVATTRGTAAPAAPAAPIAPAPTNVPKPAATQTAPEISPWQDFIDQHSALDLLNQITPFYELRTTRDGKGREEVLLSTTPNGDHNATYYPRENKCFIFTTNTSLPTETPLNPFDLYVIANYGSNSTANYSAAASDLYKAGFGTRGVTPPNPPKAARQKPNPAPSAASDGDDDGISSNPYFRILGFDKTDGNGQAFYFFQKTSNTLLRLTPSAMTKNNLMTLAPLQWWERSYPAKNGMSLDAAVNGLVQLGQEKGYFRPKFVRGRGAWLDDGRVVVHAGDKLIVDGKEIQFRDHVSKYVYEASEELEFSTKNPLTAFQADKLLDVCKLLNWEREINAYLLAGWCVIAPVCGVLQWRPHIWLTGGADTGKSWTFTNIVRKMLGKAGLAVQGATTEAGLRQTLQYDALPVVFDEAEAEDKASQDRMQSVLTLMRAASAEDGGQMVKGGADGTARSYMIRSCFAYASIAVQLSQQSDRTRVSILGFKYLHNQELRRARFEELKGIYRAHITDEFVQRLHARTIAILPTILKNAETFGQVVRDELQKQRMGDQLGILLAGAWSLMSDEIVSYEMATEFVRKADWSEEKALDQTRDEVQLLLRLSEQIVRLDKGEQRTIGELIQGACDGGTTDAGREAANDALKRVGVKVVYKIEHEYAPDGTHTEIDATVVYFSNSADAIKRFLVGTGWAKNHNKVLLRLGDDVKEVNSMRFTGISTRAVGIPIKYFKE